MSVENLAGSIEQALASWPAPALSEALAGVEEARVVLVQIAEGSDAPELPEAIAGLGQATDEVVSIQQLRERLHDVLGAYLTNLGVTAAPVVTHPVPLKSTEPPRQRSSPPDPALIAEAQRQGHKISPNRVVRIARARDDRVVWLEKGDERSGLQHIMKPVRITNFERQGIVGDEIVDAIFTALVHGKPKGVSGGDRTVYEFSHRGQPRRMAISVSANGYIVGANPVSLTRKLRPLP